MAVFNEILVGRFNRALQKLMQMKGGPPAPQLASEIQPIIQFLLGPEFRFLEGWNRYGAVAAQAAVVAASGLVRLFNPTKSGVIAIVERIRPTSVALADQATLSHGTAQTPLANTVAIGVLDSRIVSGSALSLTSASGAPAGVNIDRSLYAVNTTGELSIGETVLTPGGSLDVGWNSTNQAVGLAIQWRERAIEESEVA